MDFIGNNSTKTARILTFYRSNCRIFSNGNVSADFDGLCFKTT